MARRLNPFQPNSAVHGDLFVGRHRELAAIDKLLFQTKNRNPENVLFIGERGIGKTSLLLAAKILALRDENDSDTNDFLVLHIILDQATDLSSLAEQIQNRLERQLSKHSKAIDGLRKVWKFAKSIDSVAGVISRQNDLRTTSKIIDDIILSLASTVKLLTEDSFLADHGLSKKIDGVLLIIDEADKANDELDLGTFLKLLSETLVNEGAMQFCMIIAGLPEVKQVLQASHPSSLRLFTQYELKPLNEHDVKQVLKNGIDKSNASSQGVTPLAIKDTAAESLFVYSEGYPHFVQQIAYSAFEKNTDDVIDHDDMMNGFFSEAIDLIGDRYFKQPFYGCTLEQQKVIEAIAHNQDDWSSLTDIENHYSGSLKRIKTCLAALRRRGLILTDPEVRDQYRLQWRCFAFWVDYFRKQK